MVVSGGGWQPQVAGGGPTPLVDRLTRGSEARRASHSGSLRVAGGGPRWRVAGGVTQRKAQVAGRSGPRA